MAGTALNAEQIEAVEHGCGRAVLSAIAGSGKTLVVIHRIAHLIEARGVDPARILAVTFTKAAATEMSARLETLVGSTDVRIGTIHALARHIITRENPDYRDWYVDNDDYHMRGHAREMLKEPEYTRYKRTLRPQLITAFIGLYRNKGLRFEEHDAALRMLAAAFFETRAPGAIDAVLKACAQLEDVCEAAHELTFDAMLTKAEAMLRIDETTRLRWASKWDYVIQDESQDQSPIQAALLELLVRDKQNYMQVGDIMQAVYEFRGASPGSMHSTAHTYKPLYLSVNYRSARKIVNVSNKILASMSSGMSSGMPSGMASGMAAERPPMICASGLEGAVNIVCCSSALAEAEEALLRVSRCPPGDSAVLARTGAGLILVEHTLRAHGVPFVNLNAISFWKRREVAGPVAYLRFALGDYSFATLWLSMQVPLRYISRVNASTVHVSIAQGVRMKASDVLAAAKAKDYAVRGMAGWEETARDVTLAVRAGKGPAEALRCVIDTPVFRDWLEDEERDDVIDMQRTESVHAFLALAEQHADTRAFLLWFDSMARARGQQHDSHVEAKEDPHSVTLSSVHRAKGREWNNVVIIGCNEGVMPHRRAQNDAEELRIFYVATTRARETLTYLCSHVKGQHPAEPSCFLRLIQDRDEAVNG